MVIVLNYDTSIVYDTNKKTVSNALKNATEGKGKFILRKGNIMGKEAGILIVL